MDINMYCILRVLSRLHLPVQPQPLYLVMYNNILSYTARLSPHIDLSSVTP